MFRCLARPDPILQLKVILLGILRLTKLLFQGAELLAGGFELALLLLKAGQLLELVKLYDDHLARGRQINCFRVRIGCWASEPNSRQSEE